MLQHYHFADNTKYDKETPYRLLTLDELPEMPTVEEVDMSPTAWITEKKTVSALDEVAKSILSKIYNTESSARTGIMCNRVPEDEYRL